MSQENKTSGSPRTTALKRKVIVFIALLWAALAPLVVMLSTGALWPPTPTLLKIIWLTFVIALVHGIVFGLPLFLLLIKKRWVNSLTCVAGGSLVGITFAVLMGAWELGRSLAIAVGLGALGGLAFWVVLKVTGYFRLIAAGTGPRAEAPSTGSTPPRYLVPSLLVATLALSLAVLVAPFFTVAVDRNCQNISPARLVSLLTLRRSLKPEIGLDLIVGDDEWSTLKGAVRSIADDHSLDVHDGSGGHEDWKQFNLSLCDDQGINLLVGAVRTSNVNLQIPTRGFRIHIYVRDGTNWKAVARRLYVDLNRKWPGKMEFRDSRGKVIPAPEWLTSQ